MAAPTPNHGPTGIRRLDVGHPGAGGAPAGGIVLSCGLGSGSTLAVSPSEHWARGVAGALERGGDRSGGASDAPRARRSVSDDGP